MRDMKRIMIYDEHGDAEMISWKFREADSADFFGKSAGIVRQAIFSMSKTAGRIEPAVLCSRRTSMKRMPGEGFSLMMSKHSIQ